MYKHAKLKALMEFDAGQIPPNTNMKYFAKKCSKKRVGHV